MTVFASPTRDIFKKLKSFHVWEIRGMWHHGILQIIQALPLSNDARERRERLFWQLVMGYVSLSIADGFV